MTDDEYAPKFEFGVRPVREHEIGAKGRPHRLEFTRVFDPKMSSTNAEHLSLDELRDVHAKIGQYLEGLGG